MNRYFKSGYCFTITGIEGKYEVKEIIGKGASCIVYRTSFTNKEGIITEHLLKEYNPSQLNVFRNDNGYLCVPDKEHTAFVDGMRRFEKGYKIQLDIRQKIREVTNSTSNIQEIFSAFGTKYIDMTLFNGETYGNVQEKSLYDLIRRIKAIAQMIENYHKAGFLHLDIKPDNIFTIPETCEFVMLFDFDSVIEKSQVENSQSLSYTYSWAAPEQINFTQKNKICEATDLYAIGEILFWKIFGRHSTDEEHWSFYEYDFDANAPIFRNINPKVFPLLAELLHKTICVSIHERYQSVNKLIEKLDELIKLADPKKSYLVSTTVTPEAFFIGRDTELDAIHRMLRHDNKLFLSGIGGIGKSELAKNYAIRYKDNYDTVWFITYNGSLLFLVGDDRRIHIANFERNESDKEFIYVTKKLRKLAELCDERTLFIIDNFNDYISGESSKEELEIWESLLNLKCKLLFTTRLREWNQPTLEVKVMEKHESLLALFNKYCNVKDGQQEDVDAIIKYVGGHTLAVELIAKQLDESGESPKEMLNALRNYGLSKSGEQEVTSFKDNVRICKTPYDHIYGIFNMAKLSGDEKYILANLSFMPPEGVNRMQFKQWCELQNFNDIERLREKGWLYRMEDMFKMHPLVAEAAQAVVEKRPEYCEALFKNMVVTMNNLRRYVAFSSDKAKYIDIFCSSAKRLLVCSTICNAGVHFLSNVKSIVDGYVSASFIERCLKKVLEISLDRYGEESKQATAIYAKLGAFYLENEKLEEAKLYLLKIEHRRNWRRGTQEYIDILINRGAMYRMQGKLVKALECYTDVLNCCEEYRTKHFDGEIEAYGDIGRVYEQRENFSVATEYYQKGLDLSICLRGENHPSSARFYNNLGEVMRHQERYNEAVSFYKKSLQIRQSLYGDTHRDVAKAYITLGTVYRDLGNFREAEDNNQKALDIYLKIYGDSDIHTALAYRNLGALYGEMGIFEKAEKYSLQALRIRQDFYKDNSNHEILEIFLILSLIYKEHGDMKQSRAYMIKYINAVPK